MRPKEPQEEFSLGRGEGHDILLNDVTSSDIHAFLNFNRGVWTLEDNDSKYGTTVYMNECMPITEHYDKSIQVGRSIISISLSDSDSSFN